MAIKYLSKTSIKNKTVLLRVDVNVPIEHGRVADTFRIEQITPTIKYLQKGGNKIILCGHLGRPEGKEEKYSLKPVAELLAELLQLKFIHTDHAVPDYNIPHLIFYTGSVMEEKHRNQIQKIPGKDLVILENLRFYKGEEENDPVFSNRLASLADVYVNDAFGVDHRKDASVYGVTKDLPGFAGLLLEKEIKGLDQVLHKSKKPFVLMMGGIKISDKISTLENLGTKADKILLGGGLSTLLFMAKGYEIGLSKVEKEAMSKAKILEKNYKSKIILPMDVVVANEKMDKHSIRVCEPFAVGKKEVILDIGPKTILAFAKEIKVAKTIVWNGPMGLFEVSPFHMGTVSLARVVGGVAGRKAFAVVGGGETVDVIRHSHQTEHIDHLSTGGGAMLEYLSGKDLPGIEALK